MKNQNRNRGEYFTVFEARRGRVMCHITYQLSHENAVFPKSQSQDIRIVKSDNVFGLILIMRIM